MEPITVTAKVSGYHPVTGLYLVQGEEYRIDQGCFSDEIFERATVGTIPDEPAPVSTNNELETWH